MVLSCLFTRTAVSQCLLRGQAVKTTKTILLRTSGILPNRDFSRLLISEKTKNQLLQPGLKSALLPASFPSRVSYSSSDAPEPDYKKHSHVTIWQLERVLSAALLPAIPAALIMPSQALDTVVAIMIVMHTHWGLEAIVVDYIRPILFGNLAPKIGLGLLYVFSITMLAGLLNLIYNDFGLANSILHIWKS